MIRSPRNQASWHSDFFDSIDQTRPSDDLCRTTALALLSGHIGGTP